MPETERPPGTGCLGLCRAAGRRMGMNFETQLDKYAELVVRAGLNVQQGQEVLTSTWFIVTATILLVLAAAYAILAILMNRKNKKVRRVKKYRDL